MSGVHVFTLNFLALVFAILDVWNWLVLCIDFSSFISFLQ